MLAPTRLALRRLSRAPQSFGPRPTSIRCVCVGGYDNCNHSVCYYVVREWPCAALLLRERGVSWSRCGVGEERTDLQPPPDHGKACRWCICMDGGARLRWDSTPCTGERGRPAKPRVRRSLFAAAASCARALARVDARVWVCARDVFFCSARSSHAAAAAALWH